MTMQADHGPCTKCWKKPATGKVHPDATDNAMVCNGCAYDVRTVLGYLGYHGLVVLSASAGDAFNEAKRAATPEPPTPSSEPGKQGKAPAKKSR